jgi:hypothetical protein
MVVTMRQPAGGMRSLGPRGSVALAFISVTACIFLCEGGQARELWGATHAVAGNISRRLCQQHQKPDLCPCRYPTATWICAWQSVRRPHRRGITTCRPILHPPSRRASPPLQLPRSSGNRCVGGDGDRPQGEQAFCVCRLFGHGIVVSLFCHPGMPFQAAGGAGMHAGLTLLSTKNKTNEIGGFRDLPLQETGVPCCLGLSLTHARSQCPWSLTTLPRGNPTSCQTSSPTTPSGA